MRILPIAIGKLRHLYIFTAIHALSTLRGRNYGLVSQLLQMRSLRLRMAGRMVLHV